MIHKHNRTLVLNSDFTAFGTVSIYRSIVDSIRNQEDFEKGTSVVEYYNDFMLTSGGNKFPIPAVTRMTQYRPLKHKKIKFSKKAIFTRDQMTCCYCGTSDLTGETLTLDHVIPRVIWNKKLYPGTPTQWTNIVTACKKCNMVVKRGRTPKQAGMKLLKQPAEPNVVNFVKGLDPRNKIPKRWLPYLSPLYRNIIRTHDE
jgi:5-methylcytosine-specific restriction endonuclease McrA